MNVQPSPDELLWNTFLPEDMPPPEPPPITIRNELGDIDDKWVFMREEIKLKEKIGKNAVFIPLTHEIWGFVPTVIGIFRAPSRRTNCFIVGARKE